MMSSKIITEIRKRSREEWVVFFQSKITDLKNWAYSNVEKAVLLAFILGIFCILASRFVFGILFFVATVLFFIWRIALPESERNIPKDDKINENEEQDKK